MLLAFLMLKVYLICLSFLFINLEFNEFSFTDSLNFEVVYAVNCGGGALIDSSGIHYLADPLVDEGIASDFGIGIHIDRVREMDQIIYQTERYSTTNLIYYIPITEDGSYVLVTKYSEVYFNEPNSKVVYR